MINELQSEFDRIKPREDYFAAGGYGIIYVGGGVYWPGIVVGIRMLRHFGCMLPVEVWYRGNVEAINPDDLKDIDNVSFHDIDSMRSLDATQRADGPGGGWQAKLFALMHTRLSHVLYLDADAYVVNDPCGLFRHLDNTPFAYWYDLPGQSRSIKWDKVYPAGKNTQVIQVQGGQLLIDRIKGWKLIYIADYICNHSSYFFNYMYGDQDSWRVGLAMGSCGYTVIGKADWQNVAFICNDNKNPMIIHRCQGKLFNPHDIPKGKHRYSNPQYYLPEESRVFEYFIQQINGKLTDPASTFNNVYNKNLWNGESGAGSTLKEAQIFIDKMNDLIRSKNYKTVIDLGCGNAVIGIRLKCEQYYGYDCVDDLINKIEVRFKNSLNITFKKLDFFQNLDIIENGDILICKDVLHHWPNRMIIDWLDRLIRSKKWKTIILCQDREQKQSDCWLGGYRGLDISKYPLNQYPFRLYGNYHHKSILIYES